MASARARATRWRSPPDSDRGDRAARGVMPRRRSSGSVPAAGGLAAGLRPEPDVLGHGQVREQGGVLEDQADAALFGGQGGDVGSGQA